MKAFPSKIETELLLSLRISNFERGLNPFDSHTDNSLCDRSLKIGVRFWGKVRAVNWLHRCW